MDSSSRCSSAINLSGGRAKYPLYGPVFRRTGSDGANPFLCWKEEEEGTNGRLLTYLIHVRKGQLYVRTYIYMLASEKFEFLGAPSVGHNK